MKKKKFKREEPKIEAAVSRKREGGNVNPASVREGASLKKKLGVP